MDFGTEHVLIFSSDSMLVSKKGSLCIVRLPYRLIELTVGEITGYVKCTVSTSKWA